MIANLEDGVDNWERCMIITERAKARIEAMTPQDHEAIFQGNALISILRERQKAKAVTTSPSDAQPKP